MPKTGSTILIVLLMLFNTGFSGLVHAQRGTNSETSVSASLSETQVFNGERVTLKIEITGTNFSNVQRPELPEFDGFNLISGNPSTSTGYSIIGGERSRSYSFSYVLVATSEGIFDIPQIPVVVDGNTHSTNTLRITILNRSRAAAQANLPDIFVRMEVNDSRPVTGQQILTELVLYFKPSLEVVSFQPSTQWRTDGFWKESLADGASPRAETVILGSERYRKAVLQRHALFPSRADKLTIGEQSASVTIRQSGRYQDPFSSFFSGFGTNQRTFMLKTEPIVIQVLPITSQSSSELINAVGRFTITRRLSSQNVMIGEALEVITEIRGSGNLALISKPNYSFPEGFEIFQPQEVLDLEKTDSGIRGFKSFRDILIARRAGNFEIDASRVAYYDPESRRYIDVNLPKLPITVVRDPNVAYTFVQDRAFNIQPVTGITIWATGNHRPIIAEWWFWIGLILPVAALIIGIRKKQHLDRLKNDYTFYRKVKALDRALEILTQIRDRNDTKKVYAAMHIAVSGLIADKLSLPEAGLTDQELINFVDDHFKDESLKKDVKRFIEKCSTIRFAPVTTHQDLNREINNAENLLKQMNEAL